jgi:photosystem II stability/assembly factor-like uncharacterized protein
LFELIWGLCYVTELLTTTLRFAARALRRNRAALDLSARLVLSGLLVASFVPAIPLASAAPATAPAQVTLASAPGRNVSGWAVVDYAGGFSSATPGRLKAAGVGIAVRYVGSKSWKCLSAREANALRGAGIDIAAVYETKAKWMLGGRKAGVAAAKAARSAIIACGGPRQPFVWFACDTATNKYSTVNACLQGAASVLGANNVGVYGSYYVCANALKAHAAAKAWQTEAWSNGHVLGNAALYQPAHKTNGNLHLDYDSDYARSDDIGQWSRSMASLSWTAQQLSPSVVDTSSTPASTTAIASASLAAVTSVNATSAWAVGTGGTIEHSSDGGQTWQLQSAPTTATLHAVAFADQLTGWAVGEGGTVFQTGDEGRFWNGESTPTKSTLNGVAFLDPADGWAVGDGGTVLRTTNGGMNWTPQPSGTTASLNAIRFATPTTGVIVGAGGTILRTSNGGQTWTREAPPTTADLSAVDFADANTGWAVGAHGVTLRTTNGGSTWSAQSSGTGNALSAVDFADRLTGEAVGASGTVVYTTDGGATWLSQSSPTTQTVTAVKVMGPRSGWVLGGMSLYRYENRDASPFGSVTGVISDARTGSPLAGMSVVVNGHVVAATATDGTYSAARAGPGRTTLYFANSRYIARSSSVVTTAGLCGVMNLALTPKIVTGIGSLVTTQAAPGQATTLSVTIGPSSAATAAPTTLTGWHYEAKWVTKKVKRKKRKVRVWYWRQLFRTTPPNTGGGVLVTTRSLVPGPWRLQAAFPGSATFLPSKSWLWSITVR